MPEDTSAAQLLCVRQPHRDLWIIHVLVTLPRLLDPSDDLRLCCPPAPGVPQSSFPAFASGPPLRRYPTPSCAACPGRSGLLSALLRGAPAGAAPKGRLFFLSAYLSHLKRAGLLPYSILHTPDEGKRGIFVWLTVDARGTRPQLRRGCYVLPAGAGVQSIRCLGL